MHAYLHWSLRQLFLLVFQPTQFCREVNARYAETPRLKAVGGYLLRMLPWTVMLAVFGTLIVGYIFEASGVFFGWEPSWRGIVVGVALGVLDGVAFGMVAGVALGVPAGAAAGLVVSVLCGAAQGLVTGVALGMVAGIAEAVVGGVALGVVRGLGEGVGGGVVSGMAFGGVTGMAVSVIFGVTKGGRLAD